jgi:hypothetical protein
MFIDRETILLYLNENIELGYSILEFCSNGVKIDFNIERTNLGKIKIKSPIRGEYATELSMNNNHFISWLRNRKLNKLIDEC